MLKKVLVTGARGQLGFELCRQLGEAAVAITRRELELLDVARCRETLRDIPFAAVINCAAYTAVDEAEREPDRCFAINALSVRMLAEQCLLKGAKLVQISSDYVFDSNTTHKPRREDDTVEPRSQYAKSKFAGEQYALVAPANLVIRTGGLYGRAPYAENFVSTILKLGRERESVRVVADQIGCPSYTVDVARAILFLLAHDAGGIYHVVNQGAYSWCEFAREIFFRAGLATTVEPISTAEYGALAVRPNYSVLDTSRYHEFGGPQLPSITNALTRYFDKSRE